MLSVLIPTYNYNAFALVNELHKQLLKSKVQFEIICFDDGSKATLNQQNEKINALPFARFNALKDNVGRSAIRNQLSEEAVYSWLLFLDWLIVLEPCLDNVNILLYIYIYMYAFTTFPICLEGRERGMS